MFDLPTISTNDLKEYRWFRKFLIKNGFIMMQESIYTKLALNGVVANKIKAQVRKNLPPKGLIQMLTITEKQFHDMEFLIGKSQGVYLEDDKRLVVL